MGGRGTGALLLSSLSMLLVEAMPVPAIRVSTANDRPIRADGQYVLYWMTAHRRTRWNFALERAIDHAKRLAKPLVIFEPLRLRYRWASDRLHRFVIEGMRDHATALASKPVTYFPFVEPSPGAASPLLSQLAEDAAIVVTDEYPGFFLPRMIDAVRVRLPAALECVDSNGVMPLRAPGRTFTVAHSYRRWMQKQVLEALFEFPAANPLARVKLPRLTSLPDAVTRRWPAADLVDLLDRGGIGRLPLDHTVQPNAQIRGGAAEASKRMRRFLQRRLSDYAERRNDPDEPATSGLSPYLHFGHLSAHELVSELLAGEGWTPDCASRPNGKNHGFWNVSASAEAFLDQLLCWRELSFNTAFRCPGSYDRYESLPSWALHTLAEHRNDARPRIYRLEQFERAQTHDELWNAAQRELVQTGTMHNYLRMLWGKKILHWTESPEEALSVMIQLNNKYALDGRDPNSYGGIFWVLGRYDRPWGPKRPVFGSVRYMTSESARRKLRLTGYLQRFGGENCPASC